ncbi:MAG: hypothetical protein AAFU41_04920 [Pseudomonadota bacterium]
MKRVFLVSALFLIFAPMASAQNVVDIPDVTENEWGEEVYASPILVTREMADDWEQGTQTPEATVIAFLISKMREDDTWEALKATELTPRNERRFDDWPGLPLAEAELTRRHEYSPGFMEIHLDMGFQDGDRVRGWTDSFKLVEEADGWRITESPD